MSEFVLTQQRSFVVAQVVIDRLTQFGIIAHIGFSVDLQGEHSKVYYEVVIDEGNLKGIDHLSTIREKKKAIDALLREKNKSLRWLLNGIEA